MSHHGKQVASYLIAGLFFAIYEWLYEGEVSYIYRQEERDGTPTPGGFESFAPMDTPEDCIADIQHVLSGERVSNAQIEEAVSMLQGALGHGA